MVDWVSQYSPPSSKSFILEVGSGNGILLFTLLEAGYYPKSLSGIDYSPDAVELSKRIGATRQGGEDVNFSVCDFLSDSPPLLEGMDTQSWNVILDKGTFDAIALGPKDSQGQSPAAKYPVRVASLLRPGGFFLITCEFHLYICHRPTFQLAILRKMN